MPLPKDNYILLSYINTELRDNYTDLNCLCNDLKVEKNSITQRLKSIGYKYDITLNAFVCI